ncbi:helix-turn-helix transcriptional regulator [Nostocoides vanveenii]
MAAPRRPAPKTYTTSWPDKHATDPAADAIRLTVLALLAATKGRSIRDVAREVGVNHGSLARLVSGDAWPDARTIALIESGLKQSIWPLTRPSGTHTQRPNK